MLLARTDFGMASGDAKVTRIRVLLRLTKRLMVETID